MCSAAASFAAMVSGRTTGSTRPVLKSASWRSWRERERNAAKALDGCPNVLNIIRERCSSSTSFGPQQYG